MIINLIVTVNELNFFINVIIKYKNIDKFKNYKYINSQLK